MKLVFIRPGLGKIAEGWNLNDGCMEPLTFAVLASLTPDDVEIIFYDDRIEPVKLDEDADAACFTLETYTALRAYELMDMYRNSGIRVVAGGMHATLIPSEVREHADAVITGDAECIWNEVIRDLKNNSLRTQYEGRLSVPQAGLLPRREIYKGRKYMPVNLIQYGRGCRFVCTYCASSAYYTRQWHGRKPEDVVREIETRNLKRLIFTDDNIIADRDGALALFKALTPLKIMWGGQASLDLAEDPELMDAMVESGCLGNIFGFESLSRHSIDGMKKVPNMKNFDGYERAIQSLRQHGLFLWGAFSVGHDGDTAEGLMDTMRFTIEKKFAIASYMMLVPYPGTPLYNRLASENRLLYNGKWWLSPEYRYNHASFIPRNMTPDELENVLRSMARGFYSVPSIWSRIFDTWTHLRSPRNLALYLTYNIMYKKTSIE